MKDVNECNTYSNSSDFTSKMEIWITMKLVRRNLTIDCCAVKMYVIFAVELFKISFVLILLKEILWHVLYGLWYSNMKPLHNKYSVTGKFEF